MRIICSGQVGALIPDSTSSELKVCARVLGAVKIQQYVIWPAPVMEFISRTDHFQSPLYFSEFQPTKSLSLSFMLLATQDNELLCQLFYIYPWITAHVTSIVCSYNFSDVCPWTCRGYMLTTMQTLIMEEILCVSQNKMAKTILNIYHFLQRPINSNQITESIFFKLGMMAIIKKERNAGPTLYSIVLLVLI